MCQTSCPAIDDGDESCAIAFAALLAVSVHLWGAAQLTAFA